MAMPVESGLCFGCFCKFCCYDVRIVLMTDSNKQQEWLDEDEDVKLKDKSSDVGLDVD